ncbi:CPBP family intramembrane metalloprotease [Rhodobacteraceae bacterium SC52]|nr:CPBP family intramembrane metalloprotease [Rhodobacteraceae bacterium SC52]
MRLSRTRPFVRFVEPARTRPAVWRLIFGLLIVALVQSLCLLAVFGGLAYFSGPDNAGLWVAKLAVASTPASALGVLATFIPLLGGVWLALRVMHKRSLRSAMGARPWAGALRGATVTSAVFAPFLILELAFSGSVSNLPLGLWSKLLALTVLGVAVQTLAEEALFRGYALQQLAARFRSPLIWGGLPALAFGVLHYDTTRMGDAAPVAVALAALFGVLAADLTARSGGLGLAWGMHFSNNMFGLALLGTPGSITGLALRVTPHDAADIAQNPFLGLAWAIPLLIAWAFLRRGLRG